MNSSKRILSSAFTSSCLNTGGQTVHDLARGKQTDGMVGNSTAIRLRLASFSLCKPTDKDLMTDHMAFLLQVSGRVAAGAAAKVFG